MKAVVVRGAGGPETLRVADVPDPEPGPQDVRVRVRAAGLNRADLLQRLGRYPAPPGSPADVLGLEFAGEVESVGGAVTAWRAGDRVYGICGGGGQAELVVAHERAVARIPDRLDATQAAGVPEVFITVHDALFTQAQLALGESVLIHAVGSGIGTAAVQLARAAGARTLGTSRTPAKLERVMELGLDHAIAAEGFADAVRDLTGGDGVQVVLDVVGGAYLAANVAALAPKGRMVILATLGGADGTLPIAAFQSKRLRIMGTVLRARPLEEKIAATQAFARHVGPLLERGAVRPVVERVFQLADVSAAHAHMEANASYGKIVLAMP
ncbi:MAG: NAD(P)H-quinone oxidoreductase [Candidatus Limnocylindria bacterium]